MTMLTADYFLSGLTQRGNKNFSPKEILDGFDAQLARREGFQRQGVLFLPPPTLEDAKLIVEESKIAITTILEGHNLSLDEKVEDTTAREELVQVVRDHLGKFAY